MSQSTGRIHVKKTAQGQCHIGDVDQTGQFITLVNKSSTKEFDLKGWELIRTDARNNKKSYIFDVCNLGPGKEVKVLSFNSEDDKDDPHNAKFIIKVAKGDKCKNWGFGSGNVKLIDSNGKSVAGVDITYVAD